MRIFFHVFFFGGAGPKMDGTVGLDKGTVVLPGTYGWETMDLDQMDCGTWVDGLGTIFQGISGTWDDFFLRTQSPQKY